LGRIYRFIARFFEPGIPATCPPAERHLRDASLNVNEPDCNDFRGGHGVLISTPVD
jgi:hypothetical protein